MAFDIEMIKRFYKTLPERIKAAKKVLNRPMTLSEKILYAHLDEGNATQEYKR